MGGQAATNLISQFPDAESLSYERIKLDSKKDQVDFLNDLIILENCIYDGLVKYEEPTYLGSTRLLMFDVLLNHSNIAMHKNIETNEVFKAARKTKTSFGDVDLGFNFIKNPHEIVKAINKAENGNKFRAQLLGNEISIAVRSTKDPTKINQVDLINIADNKDYYEFSHFASIADIAVGIKGTIRDLLIRSIAATHPIDQDKLNILYHHIESRIQYQDFVTKYGDTFEYELRYSLSKDGLSYRITWYVNGKKKAYSKDGIKFDYLHNFIDSEWVKPISWKQIKDMSYLFGFKETEDIYHVVKMVELIKTFDDSRKQAIWKRFMELLDTKLPTETRPIAQISREDAQIAIDYIKKHADINL